MFNFFLHRNQIFQWLFWFGCFRYRASSSGRVFTSNHQYEYQWILWPWFFSRI